MVRSSKCILHELYDGITWIGISIPSEFCSVFFFKKTKWLKTIETLNVLRNIQSIEIYWRLLSEPVLRKLASKWLCVVLSIQNWIKRMTQSRLHVSFQKAGSNVINYQT